MKVLILGNKEFPMGTSDDPIPSGGMETDLDKLVPQLVDQGVEVHVITRKFSKTPWYEIKNGLRIHRVPWIRGKYFRNYSFNLFSFFKAWELIREEKIEVVHTVGVVASFWALFLRFLTGVKVLAEPRGLQLKIWSFPINLVLGFHEFVAYPRADLVVVQGEYQKKNLENAFKFSLERTKIIPQGIEHDQKVEPEKIRKEFNIEDEKIICFVGRFHPVKGLEYLIEAVDNLDRDDVKVLLVGDGIQMDEIKEMIKEKNLESEVILTGWRDDVKDVLAASDLFLLPSISEGLPTSLLEAMSAELPCVVTSIGLPVKHLKTGFIVPPESSSDLEEAIRKLLNNKKLRKKLGENARDYVVSNYSLEACAKEYVKAYSGLAK